MKSRLCFVAIKSCLRVDQIVGGTSVQEWELAKMKFTTVLILLGTAAFAYGTKRNARPFLSQLLGSLQLHKRTPQGNEAGPRPYSTPESETNAHEARYASSQGQNGNAKPTGKPYPSGKPFTGRPVTGKPFTGGPYTDRPFTGGPFTDGPFTGGPYTDRPFTGGPYTDEPFTGGPFTNEPFTNVPETQNERELSQILHRLRKILDQQSKSFTTNNVLSTTPTTKPDDDDDNKDDDDNDDKDHIRDLMECWLSDIMGDVFKGFPSGPIRKNLTIDGADVHYILSRAIRQFQLSDGEMDQVLKSMVRGLVKTVILPHGTCPATKFHQVIVWAMKSLLKYHLSNDTGSLKEQFKAVLTTFNFDPNNRDTVATYMVSELHHHLLREAIRFLKFQLFSDFLDPIEYIVEEMVPMFEAPRSNSHIDALLRKVGEKFPWLRTCITPRRLAEMHLDMVNEINVFVKNEEIGKFLDRAKATLKEEFLLSTGSEQISLVQQLVLTLETHIWSFVNGSNDYVEVLLTSDASRLTTALAPLMSSSQQAYVQRILTKLSPLNIRTSPAPVTKTSTVNSVNTIPSPTANVQRRHG
ncbi:uncharacterized protein LOC117336337 [Pecten maximus]|uniref:uncharacterized protein LOC117336337 n=1 Tax=Pecten maximus TaxID=6579 RepID=UPI001458D3CD|nr:uncharacterized protein LOC117336337 [Pecten maximus]